MTKIRSTIVKQVAEKVTRIVNKKRDEQRRLDQWIEREQAKRDAKHDLVTEEW